MTRFANEFFILHWVWNHSNNFSKLHFFWLDSLSTLLPWSFDCALGSKYVSEGVDDRAWLVGGGTVAVGGVGRTRLGESLGTCVERRGVSVCVGAARAGGWAPARLVTLARRLLPAACSPHGGASPPYSRGNPPAPSPRPHDLHAPRLAHPHRLPQLYLPGTVPAAPGAPHRSSDTISCSRRL